jgi:hypothetical protein
MTFKLVTYRHDRSVWISRSNPGVGESFVVAVIGKRGIVTGDDPLRSREVRELAGLLEYIEQNHTFLEGK